MSVQLGEGPQSDCARKTSTQARKQHSHPQKPSRWFPKLSPTIIPSTDLCLTLNLV